MTLPPLRSPATGAPLRAEGHALVGADERWPLVDGIPYLRAGREALAAAALARLDAGDPPAALALLLADQDDWWTGPSPAPADLAHLIAHADALTLRDAVRLLGWGRVGDYFLHRWSDPTYLAGLALLEAHWTEPATCFELACGIGHYLRDLSRRGVACTGADVVFAKLWVARRFVVPADVQLICFDAAHEWPIDAGPIKAGPIDVPFDLALCIDAFYFLPAQAANAARLRAIAPAQRVGHVHNGANPGFSAGNALQAEALSALFPYALLYDDAELTAALAESRAPVPRPAVDLAADPGVEAFALASGERPREPRAVAGGLALPPPGAPLRRNPLYQAGEIRWPSDRYRAEYAVLATYPAASAAPPHAPHAPATEAFARRRELVDLPERW